MKKNYFLILTGISLLALPGALTAQCTGGRYHDYIFPAIPAPTSNISYGSNVKLGGTTQNLLLDVYQPVGDVAVNRALVIVAHGGSFVGGTKTGTDVAPLCKDLARLGFVTASMEYRVGMTSFPFSDSAEAGAAVMRAVHDGRAAVRFFYKNVAVGGNTYGIDTNNIFIAGVSAGGFIALHLAYMDQLSEFPSYVDTLGEVGLLGGIEGQSGNPGYSSRVKGVVNICGALGDTAWIQPGDEPLLSFHGTVDNTVPYGYDYISPFGPNIIKVHGSSTVAIRADNAGIENCMETWEGQDHVPQVGGSANNVAHYDSTITLTRNFLEHLTCGVALNCSYTSPPQIVGISESVSASDLNAYPNPASDHVVVDFSALTGNTVTIEMIDVLGRVIRTISNIKDGEITILRDDLQRGIYLLNITSENKLYSKKIIFE